MNNTIKSGLSLLLATIGLAATAASSSAAITLGAPASPGGAFTGITSSASSSTFGTGPAATTCTATYGNVRGSGAPSATATFRASFSSCIIDISGIICTATVTVPTDWTITATSFVAGTGTPAGTPGSNNARYNSALQFGTLANPAPIDINIDDPSCGLSACHIYVLAQGPRTGLTTTDVGTGAVGSGAIRFAGTATTISYIPVNCLGMTPVPTTNGTYQVSGALATGAYVYGS